MLGLKRMLIPAVALAAFLSALLSGCSPSASRANPQEIAQGRELFETHCLGCHGGKIHSLAIQPPPLAGIFQHKYLPSGALATDGQVRATILGGRVGIMPPFRNVFSDHDIREIIAYLHTLKPPQASDSSNPASGT